MKAVTIEPNGRLAIREHSDPEAGVGEVLVRIRAAGEVVAVGLSADRFSIGDRVKATIKGLGVREFFIAAEA
jgi:NADPH:quinone reductase-like Zn-dependent oxidoreductase